MIALYPIKPAYTDRILSGEKTFELRKRLPKERLSHILIYSTTPVAQVVGFAKVTEVKKGKPAALWEQLANQFGIEESDYFSYFSGCDQANAIALTDVRKFVRPFSISEISIGIKVPQSFCYIDKDDFKRLKKRKTIKV